MHSMIVRDPQTNQLLLFAKGADEAIFPLLSEMARADSRTKEMQKHVDAFAEDGLRTLVYAVKILDQNLSD